MSKARARLAYTGDFEPGTMDARVLGPAIIALAEVCEQANECLNGNRARASVRIKADFKTGSFEIVYELVQSLVDHARRLAGLDPAIVGPKEILAFLGLVGTAASATAVSALRLIRAWHDTEPDIDLEASNDGKVTVRMRGKVYRVRREVVRLAKYAPLRDALGGLTRPLTEPGVKALEIRDPNPRKRRVVDVITKEEAPLLSAPVVEIAAASEEETHSGTRVAVLQIVRAGLVGDVTWTFSEGDGTSPIALAIEDRAFLERRDRGEIAFRNGDYLKVEIEWHAVLSGGRHQLKQRIGRVFEHIPRRTQTSLLQPPPPEDQGQSN